MHQLNSHPDPFLTALNSVSFAIDSQRMWQYLSPAWQQLTGFSVQDTVGTSSDTFLSFAEDRVIQTTISDLLAGKRQQATHMVHCVTAEGKTSHVELYMTIQQEQNEPPMIVGLMHDIIERKRTEDVIVLHEQYAQRVFNNMPCMVACLTPNLRVTFANAAYAAYFNKRVDEVIGASVLELLHPSQHTQARNNLSFLSKHTPHNTVETWITCPNEEQRFQRWTDHVFFDENERISAYQTVGIDLTEHKLAEDALQQSNNTFRALIENMTDIICAIDLDGNFTYLSPSWETVTGFPVEEFLGISGMVLLHPADVNTFIRRMAKIYSGDRFTESVFYRVEHADGEWHWHAASTAPIVDNAGNVTGVAAMIRDITNIREHQLLLQSTLTQLEQALKDKTLLIQEIHHRVKNNLQIVASLLSIQARQLTDERAKEALAASRNRVTAIAQIHTMMYQGDSGDTIVFNIYLQTLLERIQRAFGASDITFTVTGSGLELSFDQAVPLGLIVNELLTNAVKYAFPVPQEDAQVVISFTSEQDSITMTVEDNGVGIAPDINPESANSMGMTIVQTLATQLNGTVVFANREGFGGLRIKVWIPKQSD